MKRVISKHKSFLYFTIRFVILLITLGLLINFIDIKSVSIIYRDGFNIWLLIAVLSIGIFRVFLNAIRWKMLNISNNDIRIWGYFKYMMISHIYNLFLPGVLGGDFARAVIVSADNKNGRTKNVMSIFYDRIVGMLSIIMLAIVAFIFSQFISTGQKYVLVVGFLSLLLISYFVIRRIAKNNNKFLLIISNWKEKHILKYVKKIATDIVVFITAMYNNPLIFVKTFLISIVIHVVWFYANTLIFRSYGVDIGFFDVSLVTAVVWGITVLPISIAGIGVREISYIGLLANYGVSMETATTVSIYVFSISILLAIISLPLLLFKKNN